LESQIRQLKNDANETKEESHKLKTKNATLQKEVKNNEKVIQELVVSQNSKIGRFSNPKLMQTAQNSGFICALKNTVRDQRVEVEVYKEELLNMQQDQDFIKSKKFRKEAKIMQKNIMSLNKQLEDIHDASQMQIKGEKEKNNRLIKDKNHLKKELVEVTKLA
jgi:hypothetical protein